MVSARVWRRLWRAAAALGIAGVVVGAGIGVSGSIAGAAPTTAGTAAATWLKNQLVAGNHYLTTFTPSHPPSVGLTVDGLLAFVAAGTTGGTNFDAQVKAVIGWLDTSTNIGSYIGNTVTGYLSGGLANVALAVEAAHTVTSSYTPTSFAGTNLITKLEHTENATGAFAGGFIDPTIQALAYYGANSANPTAATATTAARAANVWLQSVEVTTGSKSAWRNFCTFTTSSLFPSANSTALAIEGLVTDPTGPATYATDVTGGVHWLEGAQNTTATTTPTAGSLPACKASGPGNVRATAQGVQGLTGTPWTALI